MPRQKKEKKQPYSYQVKRWGADVNGPRAGEVREIVRTICPSRLSTYALGMAIKRGMLGPDVESHYQDSFMARVGDYIDRACENNNLDSETFRQVFRNNIDYVVSWTLQREYKKENYQLISGNRFVPGCRAKLSPHQRETNALIFVMRLRDTINYVTGEERIRKVCGDYATVQEVKADHSRFKELERLCIAPLDYFVNCRRISGIDSESQRQEGLLAIWKAAQSYKATRFARFSSLARKALDFKFKNMLTASMAMKRKANRNLITMGGTVNGQDSFFAHLLDRMALEGWQQQQRVYNALDRNILGMDFAFSQIHPDDAPEKINFENSMHVRTLSPAELNNDILNLSPRQRKLHYKQNVPLEKFDSRAMIRQKHILGAAGVYRPGKLVELANGYFPHLNEEELLYDANEAVLKQYRSDEEDCAPTDVKPSNIGNEEDIPFLI